MCSVITRESLRVLHERDRLLLAWDHGLGTYICWSSGCLVEATGAGQRCQLRGADQPIWVQHRLGQRMVVVVEASTNLANPIWSPLATNTLTSGSSYFSDPQWTNYPGRFYRLRWP